MRVIAFATLGVLLALASPRVAAAQEAAFLAIPTYATLENPSASGYGRSVLNKTLSAGMTKFAMPALTHEDVRYVPRGDGSVFSRVAYAASRSIVTRTRDGRSTFNISEVGGSFAAVGLSNIYYSPADRTMSGTLSRWGTQVMWDTVGNELKEFWPDIHRRLRPR